MNADEVSRVLALIAATWPNFDPSDATVEVWASHIGKLTAQAGIEAVDRLGEKESFPPSLATFLAEARWVERRRRLDEQRMALPEGDRAEPEYPRDLARANIARLRQLIQQSREPGYDAEAEALAAVDDMRRFSVGPDPLYACRRCLGGRGWLEQTDGSLLACPECNPTVNRRQAEGHFSFAHHDRGHCAECDAIRSGRWRAEDFPNRDLTPAQQEF